MVGRGDICSRTADVGVLADRAAMGAEARGTGADLGVRGRSPLRRPRRLRAMLELLARALVLAQSMRRGCVTRAPLSPTGSRGKCDV